MGVWKYVIKNQLFGQAAWPYGRVAPAPNMIRLDNFKDI